MLRSPQTTGTLMDLIDLSVNKSAKDFLRARFQEWYPTEVFQKYQGPGSEIQLVKFPMCQMKPCVLSGSGKCMIIYLHTLTSLAMDLVLQELRKC